MTKKSKSQWLKNLYYVGTLLSLCFIMLQVFFARRSMIQSSEWEKAKLTIENIERFKENLKETALYGKTEALRFSDRFWPDFSKSENWRESDTLRFTYFSFFEDQQELFEDFKKTLGILNGFAYPIIMGYASEIGSYQNAILEYFTYSNFIMPVIFEEFPNMGQHSQLLYRLWLYRSEQQFLPNTNIEKIKSNWNKLLLFDGTEFTPATLQQYEKKLEKELKKIEKEIKDFRKRSLK